MSDLRDLLERALADGHGPQAGVLADPSGDLARGKTLLVRRTRNRTMGIVATAAVIVAAAVVTPMAFHGGQVHQSATGGLTPTAASKPVPSAPSAVTQVRLVAYTGAQPPGYIVKKIPAGWVIQGSTPYDLVIAPANDPDKSPDSFLGKLLVTQDNFDTADAASNGWASTTVGGHAAFYSNGNGDHSAHTAGLVIQQAAGRWLLVQAPTSLGWSQAELTQFALSVTILAAATPGHG